jgi:D-alanyl-D-alanine carboxypeptidase (penicillin-binding protein 5/6)
MTILIAANAVENGEISLSDTVPAPSSVMVKGASVWLEPGDEITVDELFRGVIIGNANDAAVTLRSAIDRLDNGYIARQDEIMKSFSLNSTKFTNEHGFIDPQRQLSSSSDISKIITELSKYDFLSEYFRTKLDYIRDGNAQLVNSNRVVQRSKDGVGYKYGYSKETGYCLVAAKERDGVRYGVVLLGFDDEDKMYERANELLEIGFTEFIPIEPKIPEELPQSIGVKGAISESVPLMTGVPRKIIIRKTHESELKTVIALPDYIYAPVKKGDVIGEIHYYLNEKVIYRLTIHSAEDVKKLKFGNILAIMTKTIFNCRY